jgi:hypothetical protein
MKNHTFSSLLFLRLFVTSCDLSPDQNKTTEESSAYKALLAETEFDVVILNGRVIDPETNFDGVRNVGVKNGELDTQAVPGQAIRRSVSKQ